MGICQTKTPNADFYTFAHPDKVKITCATAGGNTLGIYTAGSDCVREWTLTGGEARKMPVPPDKQVKHLLAIDDVVLGGAGSSVILWERQRACELIGHTGAITGLRAGWRDMRTNEAVVVSAANDGDVRVWGGPLFCECLQIERPHKRASIKCLCAKPQSTLIATGADDGSVAVMTYRTQAKQRRAAQMAAGQKESTASDGAVLFHSAAHEGPVSCVDVWHDSAFSCAVPAVDGPVYGGQAVLATGGETDTTVRLYSCREDGWRLFSRTSVAPRDGSVGQFFALEEGVTDMRLCHSDENVTGLCVTAGRTVALWDSARWDSEFMPQPLWSTECAGPVRAVHVEENIVTAVSNGVRVYVAGTEIARYEVTCFDMRTGRRPVAVTAEEPVKKISYPSHRKPVESLCTFTDVATSRQWLLTVSEDGTARAIDTEKCNGTSGALYDSSDESDFEGIE